MKELKSYDYKTRCRCLFAVTVGMLQGNDVELDENYFNSIIDFFNEKIHMDFFQYARAYKLLVYYRMSNNALKSFENEKTISQLFEILDCIKNFDDLKDLYDLLDQKDIDLISETASEYIEYMDNLFSAPSLKIPQ